MKTVTDETKEGIHSARGLPNVNSAGIDELLGVLDKDIEHLQKSLSRLDELRTLVLKRDEAALSRLLETINTESGRYLANEMKRQKLRKELADTLGYSHEQMTLTRLEGVLPQQRRRQIAEKKMKLKSLAGELRKEHLSTAMLLSECARLNRVLLKSIFDLVRPGNVLYTSKGSAKRQSDTAFVNLQF